MDAILPDPGMATTQEQELVRFWRSIGEGILEVSVLRAMPVEAKINYPYFLRVQQMGTYPLTPQEEEVIKTIRFMVFGKLYIELAAGVPVKIEPHSYRTVKFGQNIVDKKVKK